MSKASKRKKLAHLETLSTEELENNPGKYGLRKVIRRILRKRKEALELILGTPKIHRISDW